MQDAVITLCKEFNDTPENSIKTAITEKICSKIFEASWAIIALSMWRHHFENYEFQKLDNPIITCNFSEEENSLINQIRFWGKTTKKDAILLFVLFALKEKGYHL